MYARAGGFVCVMLYVVFLSSICCYFHYKAGNPLISTNSCFCRADELTRRKMMSAATSATSPGTRPWNGGGGGGGGVAPRGCASPTRKISPPNYTMKNAADETDPGQLLNEWLGELDNLQKVLHKYTIYIIACSVFEKEQPLLLCTV